MFWLEQRDDHGTSEHTLSNVLRLRATLTPPPINWDRPLHSRS
jgi:hypothetical protein